MCYKCGTGKDLRPYGLHGQDVCFLCAMATPKDVAIAQSEFLQAIQENPDDYPHIDEETKRRMNERKGH